MQAGCGMSLALLENLHRVLHLVDSTLNGCLELGEGGLHLRECESRGLCGLEGGRWLLGLGLLGRCGLLDVGRGLLGRFKKWIVSLFR